MPVLRVYKCPQELLDRVKAKAALKGRDQSEWIVQLLEKETEKLKPLQEEYRKEDEK